MGWADPETRVAAVVGDPILHSLSPTIHKAWLEAARIPGTYGMHEISREHFEPFVRQTATGGDVHGFNITAPHKEAALALADFADAAAEAAGAANLLLFDSAGRTEARNTDGLGLLTALAEQAPQLDLQGAVAVILGAGGAARSAAVTLKAAGAELRIVNRSLNRAEALAARVSGSAWDWAALPAALEGASLLVNATTLGLEGGEPLAIELHGVRKGAAVMDMIYRPLNTPLLRRAEREGLTPVDGLAMLIGQARPSFEALFGREPPDIDIRSIAVAAL